MTQELHLAIMRKKPSWTSIQKDPALRLQWDMF